MGQEEIIARRYAAGLAEHVRETGELERARDEIGRVAALLDPRSGPAYSPELGDFLASPAVPPPEKEAATKRILDQIGVCGPVADFMMVLIRRNRLVLMPRIALAFADAAGAMLGESTAVVRTARPLTTEQTERLSRALGAALGCAVRLHQRVEPELLAGAKVTVGDRTFDGTVLGRLEDLRQRMIASLRRDGESPAGDMTGGEADPMRATHAH